MPPGSELPLSRLPLDAEDPTPMSREHMRRGLRTKVPQPGIRITRSRGQEVPGRGKRSAEDGGAVTCKRVE